MNPTDCLVVGAGVWGVTAALALRRRGHHVMLVDEGPLPHPLAASTDISKVLRMEYGRDAAYMALMEESRKVWLVWNQHWQAEGSEPLYHECGVLLVTTAPMQPGGFEYESLHLLEERGHHPERLDAATLAQRFPAWSTGHYVDGFCHAHGGFAESGRVVASLLRDARREGVELREGRKVQGLLEEGNAVRGVELVGGQRLNAEEVVIAAGCWTHKLLPELQGMMRATGHAVFHLRPARPELFVSERFPVFTADVSRTGFYGFPLHPQRGVVKVALHDAGLPLDPDAPRVVQESHYQALREFLPQTFPDLVDAEIVETRLCPYSDTHNEDFLIARHPDRPGLTVAAGGSGHGFKFAPILGDLTANALEGESDPRLERFRWRLKGDDGEGEAARCHEMR